LQSLEHNFLNELPQLTRNTEGLHFANTAAAGHRQSGTTLELPQKGETCYLQDRTAAYLDNYMKIIQLLQIKCTLQATPLMLNLLLQQRSWR
jgi:hypothetical protein